MPLHYGLEQCDNWKELTTDAESPITEAIIFASMVIGIDKITADNVDEVYRRLRMYELVQGSTLICYSRQEGESDYDHVRRSRVKKAWVKRRIGLWTNASRLSNTKFHANMIALLDRFIRTNDENDQYYEKKARQELTVS